MNRYATALALILGLGMTTLATAAGIDTREARQEAAIAHGIASGRLTRCEAARLSARESRIERREAAYRATGGGLSRGERADLNRRLDVAARDIDKQSHDGRGCW